MGLLSTRRQSVGTRAQPTDRDPTDPVTQAWPMSGTEDTGPLLTSPPDPPSLSLFLCPPFGGHHSEVTCEVTTYLCVVPPLDPPHTHSCLLGSHSCLGPGLGEGDSDPSMGNRQGW